jgi:16S rRNA (cytosine1402-N4)-methyltransferase
MPKQKQIHLPVLLEEVISYLNPKEGENYLDVTAGFGGHAQKILQKTSEFKSSVLVDRDKRAIEYLSSLFSDQAISIIHQDFAGASKMLADKGEKFDMILADLGISSLHLNEAERGFAFSLSGPLDMRMDSRQELDAKYIVNEYSEEDIAKILKDYGEEPKARTVARLIVQARPIENTEKLAAVVSKAWPGYSRVHPATRTFQAIRIAVNSELTQLQESLPLWAGMLKDQGRLAIISFHSLEDRIVKQFFKEHAGNTYDSQFRLLTKKPVVASRNEIVSNPRARSAKLRVVQRK